MGSVRGCRACRAAVLLLTFTLGVLGGADASAQAQLDSAAVREGLAAYDALEYDRAAIRLEEALKESLTREERIVATRTLGLAEIARGRQAEARAAFVAWLRLDPHAELDRGVAPGTRAIFEEARTALATGQVPAAPAPGGELTPIVRPSPPREGQSVSIEVTHPGGLAARGRLFLRARGELAYAMLEATPDAGGHLVFTLPRGRVRAPGLEYHVSVLDEPGALLARAGSHVEPLTLPIAAGTRPIYRRAWFWGVIGGVVGAGLVAGLAGGLASRGPSATTPATVTLIPQ